MRLSQKIFYNSLWQLANKIISTLFGLLAVAWFARYLGSAGFGHYTSITAIASLFAILADLGLTLVAGQLINRSGINQDRLLSNLFAFRLLSATVIISLGPLLTQFLPYDSVSRQGVWLAAGAFWFVALNQVFVSLYQKTLTTGRIAAAEIISRLILALGAWLTMRYDWGLSGVLWVMLVSNGVSFLLHYCLSRSLARVGLAWDWEIWRQILNRSWPLLTTIVLNLVYLKADIIILSWLRDSIEVGLYGAAYKVVDVLVSLPFMFAGLVLPLLVGHWSAGRREDYQLVKQKFFNYTILFSVPLVVGGILLAEPIMRLVAGQEFLASGEILRVLMLAVLAVFMSCFFTHLMIAREQQKKLIPYYLLTAVTALPVYYWLIINYGSLGAAWATVYSESVMALGAAWALSRVDVEGLRLSLLPRIISASALLAATVLATMPLLAINIWWLPAIILLSAVVFFFAALAFGIIELSELKSWLSKKNNGPTINQL